MNPIDLNIEIKEINYGSKKVVLENISININQFGIYGVFGKNGQGKSTFLKSLAGIKSFIGEINLNNSKLTSRSQTRDKVITRHDWYSFLL